MPIPNQKQAILRALINAFQSKDGKGSSFNMKKLLLVIVAAVYLLSPIDVIPDFIPILGQTDDALLLIFTLITLFAGAKSAIPDTDQNSSEIEQTDQEPMRNVTPKKRKD